MQLSSETGEMQETWDLAVADLQNGRHGEALGGFDRIIAEKPNFAEAWHNRGVILALLNRPAEALVSFGRVLALKPDHLSARIQRGSALMALKRPQEALASFDKALTAAPNDATALFMRGLVLAGMERFAEALASFQAVLRLDSGHFEARYNRGIALWHLRRPAEALLDFDSILALDPNYAPGWHNRGNALRELWRLEEALASYRKALAIDPDYLEAMKGRGQVLFEMNRTEDGLAAFREGAEHVHGTARGPQSNPRLEPQHRLTHDEEQQTYLKTRKDASLETLGARLAGPAVRPDHQAAEVAAQWRSSNPQLVVIDNLFTQAALEGLRRFCLEAPVWHTSYQSGYLGAFPEHGFACPLLGQIADELRDGFPGIFGKHALNYMWGFKYDSRLSGIGIHADFAAVNVNFWITPDAANLDATSGGLVIWDAAAPWEWDFAKYNGEAAPIRDFLARTGSKSVTVPYRANRAVIFNSDLFHETDRMAFKPGYENRRINITMLYGRRGGATRT